MPVSSRTRIALACAAAALLAACSPRPPVDEHVSGAPVRPSTPDLPHESASASARAMGAAPAPLAGVRNPLAGLPGTAATPADDARIAARVRAALAAERELQGLHIDVDSNAGVVTLSGPVPSLALKARASELARQVPQVQSVNDQLTLAAS